MGWNFSNHIFRIPRILSLRIFSPSHICCNAHEPCHQVRKVRHSDQYTSLQRPSILFIPSRLRRRHSTLKDRVEKFSRTTVRMQPTRTSAAVNPILTHLNPTRLIGVISVVAVVAFCQTFVRYSMSKVCSTHLFLPKCCFAEWLWWQALHWPTGMVVWLPFPSLPLELLDLWFLLRSPYHFLVVLSFNLASTGRRQVPSLPMWQRPAKWNLKRLWR